MNYELFPYQRETVEWMKAIEENSRLNQLEEAYKKSKMIQKEEYEFIQIRGNKKAYQTPYKYDLDGGILIMEMGLGKTLISLSLIEETDKKTLVIMSKSLLANWISELEKFGFDGRIDYFVLHKSYNKNVIYDDIKDTKLILTTYDAIKASYKENKDISDDALVIGDTRIYKNKIIAYQQSRHNTAKVEHLIETIDYGMLHCIQWDRIICDESQKFANDSTILFKSVITLLGNYRWCLTGTPVRNNYKDIYTQLKFCNFSIKSKRFFTYADYIKITNIKQMTLDDANIVLPTLHKHIEWLYMDDEHMVVYNAYLQTLKDIIEQFELRLCGFSCILEAFLRLRQVCVSPTIITPEKSFPTNKINYILQKIETVHQCGEKIIVFSMYETMISYISSLISEDIDVSIITGKINSPAVRMDILNHFKKNGTVLFINYLIGAEGLNITEASNVIFIEPWWNDAIHSQAISRIYRTGQQKETYSYMPLFKGSIEEKIYEMCESKKLQSDNLINKTGKMNNVSGITLQTIKKFIT